MISCIIADMCTRKTRVKIKNVYGTLVMKEN